MRQPYEFGDQAMGKLRRATQTEFNRSRLLLRFDDLNVFSLSTSLNALYTRLRAMNEQQLLLIAQNAYEECYGDGVSILGTDAGQKKPPDRDWLMAVLLGYSPVTKYVYDHEVDRKRAVQLEAMMADKLKNSRQDLYGDIVTSQNRWTRMTDEYGIEIEDEAGLQGYADAGVKKVQWVTQHDGKVCPVCQEYDGQVFDIDDVPDKPHPNDRCYIVPYTEKPSEKT